MTTIAYQSKTEQFGPGELKRLQEMPAGRLANALTSSLPVVALRGVAEVMLNEDKEKLKLLLADPILTLRWKQYEDDLDLDERDHEYARQLQEKIDQMMNK